MNRFKSILICLGLAWAPMSLAKTLSGTNQVQAKNGTQRASHLRLGLLASFPEVTSITSAWDINRFVSIQGSYALPFTIHVQQEVASKKLVEQDGLVIRSPHLSLPIDVDLESPWSIGAEFHPFAGSFYAGVSYARRIVKVKSQVRSALIFEDGASQIMSNTEFSVDLKSRTEQELLRSVIGQRWSNKHIFWGWTLGAVKPIRSQSNIISTVRILNPMASDSADAAASNIEEARQSQENLVKSKAQKQLRILEQKTLPVVGLELGFRF